MCRRVIPRARDPVSTINFKHRYLAALQVDGEKNAISTIEIRKFDLREFPWFRDYPPRMESFVTPLERFEMARQKSPQNLWRRSRKNYWTQTVGKEQQQKTSLHSVNYSIHRSEVNSILHNIPLIKYADRLKSFRCEPTEIKISAVSSSQKLTCG